MGVLDTLSKEVVSHELPSIGMNWLTLARIEPRQQIIMANEPDTVMIVREVADYLRVNQQTVYRLAVDGKLPAFKVGETLRFKASDADGWIAAQSNQPKADKKP